MSGGFHLTLQSLETMSGFHARPSPDPVSLALTNQRLEQTGIQFSANSLLGGRKGSNSEPQKYSPLFWALVLQPFVPTSRTQSLKDQGRWAASRAAARWNVDLPMAVDVIQRNPIL